MQQILETLRETVLPWATRGEMRFMPDELFQVALSSQFLDLPTCPQPYRPHPYYEWIWMVSGEAPIKIGDRMYVLRPGDFCIFPPLVERGHLYNRETSDFHLICCAYWPGSLHVHPFDYKPFGTWSVRKYFESHASSGIATLLTGLHNETLTDRPHKLQSLQGLVLQLITTCLRDLEDAVAMPALRLDADRAVGQVLRLLHERYDHDWTLTALAEEAYIQPRYLARLFKAHTGRTVFETLRAIRIEHAKSLLIEDNLTLSKIAHAVGYRSAERFARVFRESTGLPPTRYGKRARS